MFFPKMPIATVEASAVKTLKKRKAWIGWLIIITIIVAAVVGFYYYAKKKGGIQVEEGVTVDNIDEKL